MGRAAARMQPATDAARRGWSYARRHHVGPRLAMVLTALTGAVTAVTLWGSVHHDVGPVRASFAVQPRLHGGTEIVIPPLGRLKVDSHTGPLHVKTVVTGVDLADSKRILAGNVSGTELETAVTNDVRRAMWLLVIKVALLSVAGGAAAVLLVFRRALPALVAVATVVVAVATTGGAAAATWRPQAFSQPRFSGLLASAPTLIGSIDDIPSRFDTYRAELARIVTNVSKLYDVTSTLPPALSAQAIPVLWVADIHDNPEAFSVMSSLVEQFQVKAVVDSGDISDHGAAAENPLFRPVGSLGVPYLYVRGNHDSAATQRYLAGLGNVTVLDNGAIKEVVGLRWAGTGDPTFTPNKDVAQQDSTDVLLQDAGQKLATAIDGKGVDVAVVHEPAMAAPLDGTVPLVLDGHVHRRAVVATASTTAITQGSSGGAGLRSLEGEEPHPLEMSILYFDPQTRRLLAADEVTLSGLGGESVTIQRHRLEYYTKDPQPDLRAAGR